MMRGMKLTTLKRILSVLAGSGCAVWLAGCSATVTGQGEVGASATLASSAGASPNEGRTRIEVPETGQDAYMEVATGKVFTYSEKAMPQAPYVVGVLSEGEFSPSSHVKGEYPCLCGLDRYFKPLQRGWRNVSTGEFIAAQGGGFRPPRPYVLGDLNKETGRFTPESRAVAF
jgi:hypothetical protein